MVRNRMPAQNDTRGIPIVLKQQEKRSESQKLSVSYINKVDSWKTYYKLEILPNKIFLSLNGMVRNSNEFDWEEINLSLVANDLILQDQSNSQPKEKKKVENHGDFQLFIKTLTGKTVTISV
jgi:hypothetical protein